MSRIFDKMIKEITNDILKHLEIVSEEIENNIKYIKGDIEKIFSTNCMKHGLVQKVCQDVKEILDEIEEMNKSENYYKVELFGDFFENYVQLLVSYHNNYSNDKMLYHDKINELFKLMFKLRKTIEIGEEILKIDLENKISLKDGFIIDDKIRINLENLQSITIINKKKSNFLVKMFPIIQLLGLPIFLLAIIASLIIIGIDISYNIQSSREISKLTYERGNAESVSEYYNNVQIITEKFKNLKDENMAFRVSSKVSNYGYKIYVIYLIIGHILCFIIKKNADKGSASAKYILAYLKIDVGLFLFFASVEKYKLLMVNAAHEGSEDALLKLGFLYEIGFFNKSNIDVERKKALECYSRILHNKKALKRYNRLRKLV